MRAYKIVRLVMVPVMALALVIPLMIMLSSGGRGDLTVRAAPWQRPLGYEVIATDATWGPGVVTKTSDVVIQNGATLIIAPGTTVVLGTWDVPTDTAPYAGGASDKVEIIVEDGGRLVADGFYTETQLVTPTQSITFTSGTYGDPPWGGIRVLGEGGAGESVIRYAAIKQASGGIYVENCSPTVTHNLIHQIWGDWGENGAEGADGADGDDGIDSSPNGGDGVSGGHGGDGTAGKLAYGILITGAESTPWVAFNTIEDINGGGGGFGGSGGDGGSGGNGYAHDAQPGQGYDGGLGAPGGNGGNGARGGDAAGIYIHDASPTIFGNVLDGIGGGSGGGGGGGGHGGNGGHGSAGEANLSQQAAFPGGDGEEGGHGGAGGTAGPSGQGWGIYVGGSAAPDIRGNTILYVSGGQNYSGGGNGGNGGIGGNGGNAGGWSSGGACGSAKPGAAGNGGHGGDGGDGGAGGKAVGIHTTHETEAQIVDNYILGVFGGEGDEGGSPGSGGAGGNGADGSSGSTGGAGGAGGLGGNGGAGGLAVGMRGPGAATEFRRNTILSVHGGDGGGGGSGYYGDGGAGGDGGSSSCQGSGGDGGAGGRGPSNGNGGDGDNGVGILSDAPVGVENNVVYGLAGGAGGMGGLSYHPEAGDGGDGGAGGNGHDGGAGGDGGDGGAGGNAGNGGSGAAGLGIMAEGAIVNNTIDRLDRGLAGLAGTPGAGGGGGLAGEIGGGAGTEGSTGAAAQPGVDGMTVGLVFDTGATGDAYNNIIVRTVYTDSNDYYVGTLTNSVGVSGTASANLNLDYNDVWGWETNYVGVTAGPHDLNADPLFADLFCMDCEDFRLRAGSPCIDAADDGQAPKDDRDNVLRPQDGDLDDVAAADIGAYEYLTDTTFVITCGASDVYTTTDERLAFEWSAGMCTTCTITATYTPLAYPAASVGALVFGDQAFALDAEDCHGNPVIDLMPPLTLTVHYDEPASGVNEGTLAVYRWDAPGWTWQALTVQLRNMVSNTLTVELDHLSDFALLGESMTPSTAPINKSVAPEGRVEYGDELTYTLVISAAPGTRLGLYDPLEGTAFLRFVTGQQPAGIVRAGNVVTGTLKVTPTNRVTVSFVAQVGIPGTVGWTADVSNRACIYPAGGSAPEDCTWSEVVTNQALHPYTIYLPLILKN